MCLKEYNSLWQVSCAAIERLFVYDDTNMPAIERLFVYDDTNTPAIERLFGYHDTATPAIERLVKYYDTVTATPVVCLCVTASLLRRLSICLNILMGIQIILMLLSA